MSCPRRRFPSRAAPVAVPARPPVPTCIRPLRLPFDGANIAVNHADGKLDLDRRRFGERPKPGHGHPDPLDFDGLGLGQPLDGVGLDQVDDQNRCGLSGHRLRCARTPIPRTSISPATASGGEAGHEARRSAARKVDPIVGHQTGAAGRSGAGRGRTCRRPRGRAAGPLIRQARSQLACDRAGWASDRAIRRDGIRVTKRAPAIGSVRMAPVLGRAGVPPWASAICREIAQPQPRMACRNPRIRGAPYRSARRSPPPCPRRNAGAFVGDGRPSAPSLLAGERDRDDDPPIGRTENDSALDDQVAEHLDQPALDPVDHGSPARRRISTDDAGDAVGPVAIRADRRPSPASGNRSIRAPFRPRDNSASRREASEMSVISLIEPPNVLLNDGHQLALLVRDPGCGPPSRRR